MERVGDRILQNFISEAVHHRDFIEFVEKSNNSGDETLNGRSGMVFQAIVNNIDDDDDAGDD